MFHCSPFLEQTHKLHNMNSPHNIVQIESIREHRWAQRKEHRQKRAIKFLHNISCTHCTRVRCCWCCWIMRKRLNWKGYVFLTFFLVSWLKVGESNDRQNKEIWNKRKFARKRKRINWTIVNVIIKVFCSFPADRRTMAWNANGEATWQ